MGLDPAVAALGDRLRSIGYETSRLERRIGRIPDRLTPGVVALAERRAGDDPLGLAVRFWSLGLPLPAASLDAMLGGVQRDALVAAGLIGPDGDTWLAILRISPALGRLQAHDFDRGAALPANHVLGVGSATHTLSGITPPSTSGRALDLGTGCGVLAFGLAQHASEVVATDINQRAIWAARIGAALNGVERLDLRVGDGLAPVAEEDFDLIVCNPPFVVSPADELTFRDGGLRGDALSRRLTQGVAAQLRPGGVACLLVNWIVPARSKATEVVRGWVAGLSADVLVLHHDALDPLAYAERWMLLPTDVPLERRRAELDRWLVELERLGAARVAAGAIVIDRTDRPLRLRVAHMRKRPNEGGAQVRRMLDAIGRFSGADDAALPATVFRLVPGHHLEQRLHYGSGGYRPAPVTLRFDRSAGVLASVPADLLEAVFLIDGQRDLASIATEVAAARDLPTWEITTALASVAQELYELGFLEVVEHTGS